jgi:hypothetical protein
LYRIVIFGEWRTQMDEYELTAWLEEQLGRRLSEDVLKRLRKDGYLHVEGAGELVDVLKRTRWLLQFNTSDSKRTPRRRPTRKLASEKTLRALAKRDELRRDAVSVYWAKDASTQGEVRRFRQEVLGGRLLTSDEAQDLLISPAALMFSVDELVAKNIEPARHHARVTTQEAEFRGAYRAVVQVKRPRVRLEFRVDATDSNPWDGQRPLGTEELNVRVEGRVRVQARAWRGSVLHLVKQVAEALERRNYPWLAGDAAWFILTGQAPSIAAIGHSIDWRMGSHGTRAVINLHVEPWVSVERVTALYRELQTQILGGHNRPISERRIALFRFVTERADDEGELPPWRALIGEWNDFQHKWKYQNVRNFSRDYWAAARMLLFPKYKLF